MDLGWLKPVLRPNAGHLSLLAAVGLAVIGLAAIDTAPTASWVGRVAVRQGVYLVVAVVGCVMVALPHHRQIGLLAYPAAVGTALLLALLLVPGMPDGLIPERNGARRWVDLGVIQFQPSELAKIAYVLALARYLRYRANYRTLRGLAVPFLLTGVPMLLIVKEPDLGTAALFVPVLFAMLMTAGARLMHLASIVGAGLLLVASVLTVELGVFPERAFILKPHQKARIVSMASQLAGETTHRRGSGFQAYKAKTMTGAGGVRGYGKERAATILRFNALPEAHNDMIFAVVCARWGLFGGLAVLGLYLLLLGSGLAVAAMNKDPFARLVVVGVVSVIFTQVFVNVGMTVGLMPITGMPLPLLSYGGSSLVANFAMVGLILNAGARRPIILARPAFEFDGSAQRI